MSPDGSSCGYCPFHLMFVSILVADVCFCIGYLFDFLPLDGYILPPIYYCKLITSHSENSGRLDINHWDSSSVSYLWESKADREAQNLARFVLIFAHRIITCIDYRFFKIEVS